MNFCLLAPCAVSWKKLIFWASMCSSSSWPKKWHQFSPVKTCLKHLKVKKWENPHLSCHLSSGGAGGGGGGGGGQGLLDWVDSVQTAQSDVIAWSVVIVALFHTLLHAQIKIIIPGLFWLDRFLRMLQSYFPPFVDQIIWATGLLVHVGPECLWVAPWLKKCYGTILTFGQRADPPF